MNFFQLKTKKGFTLIELLVAIAISSLIIMAVSWILITSLRSNTVIWEQLATQNEGRKVLQQVVDDVRRAEESSVGGFSIVSADEYEFIFYANIDSDSARERVRFWLENQIVKKGVIKPTGTPLTYNLENEQVVELAHNVKNAEENDPFFTYYDENYSGSEDPLPDPVSVSDVRVVRVQLELENDPTKSPVPLHVESVVQVRNLKTN